MAKDKKHCKVEGCGELAKAAKQLCWRHYRRAAKIERGELRPDELNAKRRPDNGGYVYVGTRVEPEVFQALTKAAGAKGVGSYTQHRQILAKWAQAYRARHAG